MKESSSLSPLTNFSLNCGIIENVYLSNFVLSNFGRLIAPAITTLLIPLFFNVSKRNPNFSNSHVTNRLAWIVSDSENAILMDLE